MASVTKLSKPPMLVLLVGAVAVAVQKRVGESLVWVINVGVDAVYPA